MSFPLKEVFFDSMGLSVTAAVGYVIAPRILNSYIGRNTMRNILVIKTLHNKGNFKILILSEYLCICVSFFFKKLEPVFAFLIMKDEAKNLERAMLPFVYDTIC